MAQLTPEEQWALINVAGADTAIFNKIQSIRTAMTNAEVKSTDGLETNVEGVPLKFHEEGAYLIIEVGTDSMNKPQVYMKIPSVWLEG